MSNELILQALFNQQRLQILELGVIHKKFSDSYLFAWESGVHPIYNDTDGSTLQKPHEVYKDIFTASADQVMNVLKYLDDLWLAKTPPTFYQLEEHYGGKFDLEYGRSTLIDICRYLFLSNRFDDELWNTLLTPMEHPSEAAYLTIDFDRDDILFN